MMTALTTPSSARFDSLPDKPFYLPEGYRSNTARPTTEDLADYWTPDRVAMSVKYQAHVYRWAASLIRSRRLESFLDVGCGCGVKIAPYIAPLISDIEAIDHPAAVAKCRELGVPATFRAADLEAPGIKPWRAFDLIVCADVIEHLRNPDPMLDLIRGLSHRRTLVIFSTPDRDRLRGRDCLVCEKPDHVREWSAPEFRALLAARGFECKAWKLIPQDDTPMHRCWIPELRFRAGFAPRSPLACHAVLCTVADGDEPA